MRYAKGGEPCRRSGRSSPPKSSQQTVTTGTIVIEVVSDASVALKWFHEEGEQEVESSRALVELFGKRRIALSVLDLTPYEVGNALLRGHAKATSEQTATVLGALGLICPQVKPSLDELASAAALAETNDLTLYDAMYAAVARSRGAHLATMDAALLRAGLGSRPSEIVATVRSGR